MFLYLEFTTINASSLHAADIVFKSLFLAVFFTAGSNIMSAVAIVALFEVQVIDPSPDTPAFPVAFLRS